MAIWCIWVIQFHVNVYELLMNVSWVLLLLSHLILLRDVSTVWLVPTLFGTTMDNMVSFALQYCFHYLSHALAGLIHYRIVIHAFVDGFSRLVTGIQATDNNRAETVLNLFHDAREEHGTPCRVRGDHGTENLQVADFMESNYGVDRGSYIWGR